MNRTERLLYEPRPFTDPEPEHYKDYDIADVNPKWIKDVLGDHWEYSRSPREISFIAQNKGNMAQIRFTPEMFHVFSLEEGRKDEGADNSLEFLELGKIKFPSHIGAGKSFEVITRDGRTIIDLIGSGKYFRASTLFLPERGESSISRVCFLNPKLPTEE